MYNIIFRRVQKGSNQSPFEKRGNKKNYQNRNQEEEGWATGS